MPNREITYYSLLNKSNLRHIESVADRLDEQSFIGLGFEKKWLPHLWIEANNEAFLEHISYQSDLNKLDEILGEQLKLYARKQGEGNEQDKGDFYNTFKARKDWLKHTIFICKNEYSKTQNEVFKETIEWCIDWQNEWLETFNPYSPTDLKEMNKDLKKPLWEYLNKSEPSLQIKQQPDEIEVWFSEYELRQFIDTATRWQIDAVYKIRTEQNPFSIFDYEIKAARNNFEKFSTQLNRKLSNNENWKAIGIDLNDRFLKGINRYIFWHNENKVELEKFQPHCPYSLMLNIVESTKSEILKYFPELEAENSQPQQTEKPKPEPNDALITFSNPEIIDNLHNELKGYFQAKESELKKALQGKQLKELLLFPHNQNKFVEVFKRLKYNGFLLSTPKETKDWICSIFTYQYKKGSKKEVRKFNTSTVHDILTKDKGEPTKNERICIVDWLPYKSRLTRQREADKEIT